MDHPSAEPYRLQLLGPWDLRGPDGTVVRSLLSQPKRLCLLAFLALSGEPIARSKIVALFWPESDEERARNALNQAVHYLRRSLTKDAVQSVEGDRIWVPREVVWFDAREVLEGQGDGVGAPATTPVVPEGLAGSWEFFDGWNAEDSQPLQDWLDRVRREVATEIVSATQGRSAWHGEAGESQEQVDVDAGMDGKDTEDPPGVMRRPGRRRALTGTVAASLVALIALGIGWTSVGPDDPPSEVAVLMPRVFSSGVVPALTGVFVHEELVARLSQTNGAAIKSIRTVGSVAEFVELLEAQGAENRPAWVVTVSVRLADGRARVIGTLLQGPDYANTPASPVLDYLIDSDEHALMELPRLIAEDVADEFAAWIGER